MVASAREVVSCDVSSLCRPAAKGGFRCQTWSGLPDAVAQEIRFLPGQGLSGRCAREGAPYHAADLWRDQRALYGKEAVGRDAAAALFLPILHDDETVAGVLGLGRFMPRGFSTEDRAFAQALVRFISLAWEYERAYQELKAQRDAPLGPLEEAIRGRLSPLPALGIIVQVLAEQWRPGLACTALWGPEPEMLWVAAAAGSKAGLVTQKRFRPGRSLLGRALSGRMEIVKDLAELEPLELPLAGEFVGEPALLCPISFQGRALGTLNLVGRGTQQDYTEHHAGKGQAFASLAGTVLGVLQEWMSVWSQPSKRPP